MAAVNYSQVPGARPEVRLASWTLTQADPTGDGISWPEHADVCWQVTSTYGGGAATVTAQGSNSNVSANYAALKDVDGTGNATWTTGTAVRQTIQAPLYLRPVLSGGDGTTSLVVTALLRKKPRNGA